MSTTSRRSPNGRSALVARWLHLTRVTLPGLSRERRWPIHSDHCFMRVCLDAAFGRPWDEATARPAIRTMEDVDLARAVDIATSLAEGRVPLEPLNDRSIRARRSRRTSAAKG